MSNKVNLSIIFFPEERLKKFSLILLLFFSTDRQLEGKECLVDDDCGDLEKYFCDLNIFVCKDMNEANGGK